MLLCNAIVGNYDESNFKTVPERLLIERRMIMSGSSDSNTIYILFRVMPSENDFIPKGNQGLIINYYSMNKSEYNYDENNKKCHYLVPIYNDYNVFCYWISSRYLRIKKKELCFAISDFIKEYWKQPIFTREFTNDIFMSNNNVLSFGSIPDDYPGYNRIINIEREENVQMICINLKYRNKDFIIIENLIESTKALLAPSSVFNGNSTIKDFYISEEQDLEQENEQELEQKQENELERDRDLEKDLKQNQEQKQEQEKKKEQEQNNKYQTQDVEKMCENEKMRNEVVLIPDISNKEDPKVFLNDYTVKEEEDILKNESNCELMFTSTQKNDSESSHLFTVCTGTNVNIIHHKKLNSATSNSLAINKEEVVINQISESNKRKNTISNTNECQITNSPLTLEAEITPITTPVNRNFKNRVKNKNNEGFQEIHSKTDLIQRNYSIIQSVDHFSSTHNFDTCKTRNQLNSFLPPGMQIDAGIGNINQMNREELILNRIESARKNVNLNHRIYSGGNFFGGCIQGNRAKISGEGGICAGIGNYSICTNNHAGGTIINSIGRINGNYNASFDNNIDILSKKFNRVIGKADYLLEQLSNNGDPNIKFQRVKNEADSYNENPFNRKSRLSNSSSSLINSLQYHPFDFQKSTNSQVLLDNTFNIRNVIVEKQAQVPYNSNADQTNQKNSKNFNYSRESNLSIVNSNDVEIKKVFVDVQINTHLDNSNDEVEQNVEPLEIPQTKSNHKESLEQVVDSEKVQEPLEKGLQTVDFDEKLRESNSFEEVEEVEIRRRSIIDPELIEVDFYVNGGKLKSSFSILNILLSRWSGIPIVSKL
ncbi:uncharacterized protein ELE39_003198 [Cryptosporidium sp. chipmunk genotype I]|uniref:uncharacterized protein n=1 Tax=Cryptosporidium sp. chipmunk genotype I TaxID=1280935 RepID=UPI00351A9E4C|nr:hypothetical protein ELE39_003198 [Cryptosporidium sp. chipmunk genotype I]